MPRTSEGDLTPLVLNISLSLEDGAAYFQRYAVMGGYGEVYRYEMAVGKRVEMCLGPSRSIFSTHRA